MRNDFSRRAVVKAAAGMLAAPIVRADESAVTRGVPVFDGKTLDGWIQIENSATSFSSSAIANAFGFWMKVEKDSSAISVFLRGQLPDTAKSDVKELAKELNRIVAGPLIYDQARFAGIVLRPETARLAAENPAGYRASHLNKLLLEDAFPELGRSASNGWIVKDGAMASTGAGRGVIYTAKDYGRFRLMFTMRHVSGNPDHQACVLIFCTRPQGDAKPLDALGGIQFQVPNGGHWDYRPGMNNAGGAEFTKLSQARFDAHDWSRVEILADAAKGTARMAVAQPVGSKAVEVLAFREPPAGKVGPVALQMHNAGLFDEYKDVTIEADPADDRLVTIG